ncbi:MAG: RNA-guided pseudouridylation complex pseudouridine synthase subunit Cbf5 [archaeon]|nr:RNA-guided pseudouridylation complex pseudouridine synthase subunit Cbf5 [archaeon]
MERLPLPADGKKELIIKAEEETDLNFGVIPKERTPLSNYMNYGIINLDKPSGPTSHEVVTWVKKLLEVNKTGHGGTLDPKVTGVLPTAIGEAAKVVQALLSAGKEYTCVVEFHREVKLAQIRSLFNLFTTEIWQRPPVISAVSRVLRKRRIYYLDLFEINNRTVLFKVGCQAGTYIRKLCHDFGEVLLCGAHMAELRRTRAGLFTEDDTLYTLQDINDAYYIYKEEGDESYIRQIIQPMEKAVEHIDKIFIRDTAVDSICHGADLAVNGVLSLNAGIEKGDLIAIMTQKGELICLAKALQSARKIASIKSGLVAKTKRVLMPRKTYPYFKKTK